MESIKLGVLFPDTLFLHGERGNHLALKRVAEEAGYPMKVDYIGLSDSFNPLDYDILYMPAGELVRAEAVHDALMPVMEELKTFIRQGRPMFVTGTSSAFFGDRIVYQNGDIVDGLGLIPVVFTENPAVYGDDLWIKTCYQGQDFELIGNQIMMADWIRSGGKPFGLIKYGYGNHQDIDEGIRIENAVFTNMLGPLFVLNPDLALKVVELAAANKGFEVDSKPVDMEIEKAGRESRKNFIKNKKSRLTNSNF